MDKPSNATTISGLARECGVSRTAVAKWLADDRWPFNRTPGGTGWDVAAVQQWRATTLAEPTRGQKQAAADPADAADPIADTPEFAGMGAERIARLQLLLERIALAKLDRKMKTRGLVRTRVALAHLQQMAAVFRDVVQSLPEDLTWNLGGLTPDSAAAKAVIERRTREILTDLSTGTEWRRFPPEAYAK